MNPDDPALRRFATGSQLDNVLAETAKRKADGLAFRRASPSAGRRDVKVVDIKDEAASSRMSVNDGVIYKVATGEVVDSAVVTHGILSMARCG